MNVSENDHDTIRFKENGKCKTLDELAASERGLPCLVIDVIFMESENNEQQDYIHSVFINELKRILDLHKDEYTLIP